MGASDDAFKGIADQVFACKDAQTSKGIRIEEPVPNASFSQAHSKALAYDPKDKGNGKLIDEDHFKAAHAKFKDIGLSSMGSAAHEFYQSDSCEIIIPNVPASTLSSSPEMGALPASSGSQVQNASLNTLSALEILGSSSTAVDKEALLYIQEALMNMIDPPLFKDNLMDMEEVLMELAMYEEIHLKSAQEIPKPSSG